MVVKRVLNAYFTNREEIVIGFGLEEPRRSELLMMAYTPQQIANYFLERAEIERVPMTQLKLIKLVYIAYGWYLALTNKKLFSEEIQAWKHGPVVRSIYDEFKDYGKRPIDRRSYDLDLDTFEMHAPQIDAADKDTALVLDRVWGSYKRLDAWTLREKTHEFDSPWHRVYKEGVMNITLNDSDIREHYTQRIRQYLDAAKAAKAANG